MTTAEEALAFFRSRGFHAFPARPYGTGSMYVAARLSANDQMIRTMLPPVLLGEQEQRWLVRDASNPREPGDCFDSLADAVNALLARLQEWLALHPE